MKSLLSSFSFTKHTIPIVLLPVLFGCTATPKHTNVLIFGTNTKVALDVSQDATASVGVTLGYKRQEAVWMPLLPNQATTTEDGLKPSTCTTADCPKFEGVDGAQRDTYSVLASFGSKLGGGIDSEGKKAQVTGEIAQYFATGLAARMLAQNGGAGLVNTNGNVALTAAQQAEIADKVKVMDNEFNELLIELMDSKDPKKVNAARRDQALAKPPGINIAESRRKRIVAANSMDELKKVITAYPHESIAKPMLDTLNAK